MNNLKNLLGARDSNPGASAKLCGTVTPLGKLFLFEARGRSWIFDRQEERKRLSAGREIFFCSLEEHVMASEIAYWKDSVELWRVEHTSEKGMYHLAERGTLPPSYQTLKQARIAEQDKEGGADAEVDVILSVPMDLALEFTGYNGEMDSPDGETFQWSCSKPGGFLSRLWGNS